MRRLPETTHEGQKICTVRQWFRMNRQQGTFLQHGALHCLLMALGTVADANERLKRLSEGLEFRSSDFVRAGIALAMAAEDTAFEAFQLQLRQALTFREALEAARAQAMQAAARDWLIVAGVKDDLQGRFTMADVVNPMRQTAAAVLERWGAKPGETSVTRDGFTITITVEDPPVTTG